PFRPWLLTVVRNRCRKHSRRHALAVEPLEECDESVILYGHSPRDGLEQILLSEAQSDLFSTLATLPAEQMRVLALRYFAELELADIPLVTNAPLGTVKSRLNRALNTLRERLSQDAKLADSCRAILPQSYTEQ